MSIELIVMSVYRSEDSTSVEMSMGSWPASPCPASRMASAKRSITVEVADSVLPERDSLAAVLMSCSILPQPGILSERSVRLNSIATRRCVPRVAS